MRKIFFVVMAVIGFLIPTNAMAAGEYPEPNAVMLDNDYFIYMDNATSQTYAFVFYGTAFPYVQGGSSTAVTWSLGETETTASKVVQYRAYNGVWQTMTTHYAPTVLVNEIGENSFMEGNIPIYTDSSKSGFFLNAPEQPAPILKTRQIPGMMVETLVGGGVLSVALIIFASLLGVGLVRRLPSLFLRWRQ